MSNIDSILEKDFKKYFSRKPNFFRVIKLIITNDITYRRWKYVKNMRYCDLYSYNSSLIEKFKKLYYQRKKNKLGLLFGYEIGSKNIGPGLCLYHNGPIVIHEKAIIGENCSLHGDNCIGNNGLNDQCPIIGNNVDIGVGAKIIGNIQIADNVIIGAGSIVVSNIDKEGAIVVGVPGKIIK